MPTDSGAEPASAGPAFSFTHAADWERGLAHLARGQFAAVLFDARLPQARDAEAVRVLRSRSPATALVALLPPGVNPDSQLGAEVDGLLPAAQATPHAVAQALLWTLHQRAQAEAAAALQRSEARFRNIIERNVDGIIVVDGEGRVRFVNPAAQALLGRPLAALSGEMFGFPLVSGETVEVDVLRPDGDSAIAEMRVVPTQWEGQPAYLAALRDITDRKRIEAAEREQRALAEALRDTAAVLTSTLEFDAVLDRILANVGRVAPHDTAGIMLLEGDRLARIVRSKGYPVRRWEQASQRAVEEWYGLRAILVTGQPLVVPDTALCPDWVAAPGSQWVRSYVGAPLRLKRKVIGFINLNSTEPNLFSQRHADNLQAFADQAAIAIENAQLYEASRRYAAEAEALYHASEFLLGPPDNLPALAQQIARAITQDFGMVACSVLWLDESDVALHRLAHAGIPSATAPLGLTLSGPSLPALAARTGDSVYVPNVAADARARVDSPHIRSQLAIPLRAAGRVLGVLDLQSPEPAAFDEAARRIVSAFAERASLALENARLYQQVVQAADRRATVYRAAQEIGASLDHEQIGAALQRAVAQIMPADRLVIALVSEDRRSLQDVFVYDRSRPRWTKARRPLETGLLGRVVGLGHAYRGAHHSSEDTPPPPGPLLIELRSVMATPLRVAESVTGALAVYAEGANAYLAEDQMLLEMLAAHAATVLENTRLFQNVQRLANTDTLTRLYNRRHLFDRAQHEYERAARYGRPLSVLMLDIDHFKQINDTFGHAEGDQVLRVVAARCREGLRDVDLVGRYGGEEFAILLPETSLADARQAAERLRRQVARSPIHTGRNAITVTISLGVTTWEVSSNASLSVLLDRADQALYAAKRAGRNCVRLWNAPEPKLEPAD